MALSVMRRHRRWLYVFLWIVILGFIVFYIPLFRSGVDAGAPGEAIATVGGEPITMAEFQKAYQRQRAFYERMYQGRMTPAMLRRLGLENQVLESLVSERLVALEAKRLGLTVDDESLAHALTTSPEFQENGRFLGGDEIRRRLEMQGVTVAEFEEGSARPPPARPARGPRHRAPGRLSRRGGAGVQAAHRAGQGRVRGGRGRARSGLR